MSSTAIAPPPVNTPVADKGGQINPLWSRFYVDLQQTVTYSVAPADARYLVLAANPSLTDEFSLGTLTAGHLSMTVAGAVAAVQSSATIPSADLTGALPALNASALTNLTSANLVGALPAISGAALTSLTSANLVGALPAISGSALTALNAAVLSGALPALNASALTSLTATALTYAVVTVTFGMSPYAVLASDSSLLVNATGGAVSITLPTPTSGRVLCVKKIDAVNTVTLTGTVDGVVNPTLTVQWQSRILQGDGANWVILGQV